LVSNLGPILDKRETAAPAVSSALNAQATSMSFSHTASIGRMRERNTIIYKHLLG
jgi:hypothetical protein